MNTKTKIDCPVCGYQGIEGNICPNCDTDVSLIRSLAELPQLRKILDNRHRYLNADDRHYYRCRG